MLDKFEKANHLMDHLESLIRTIEAVRDNDPEVWETIRGRYVNATNKFNQAAASELAKRDSSKR